MVVLLGVGQPFLLQADGVVHLAIPGINLVVPVRLQEVPLVAAILLPVHTSMVVLQATIGMAVNA